MYTGNRYWEELLLAIIGEQFDVGNEVSTAYSSKHTYMT
jgi:hypothetical protein